jgi:hypothetical protein
MALEAVCRLSTVLEEIRVTGTVGFLVPGECWAGIQKSFGGGWVANSKFEIRIAKPWLAGQQLTGYHSGSPLFGGTGRGS